MEAKPVETAKPPPEAAKPEPKPATAAAPAPASPTPTDQAAKPAAPPPEKEAPAEEAMIISTQERFLPGSEPHSPGTWGRAFTDPRNLRQAPGTVGALGLIRVASADLGPPGLLRFSAYGDYFSSENFPVLNAADVRSSGTFAISYVPVDFLEAYLSYSASANTNSLTSPRLIEALGDVNFGLAAAHEWFPGLRAGVDARLLTFPGVGSQDIRTYALGFAPSALVTYDCRSLSPSFALRVHVNAGYIFDGTGDLVRQHTLTAGEEFALGINRFNRFTFGAALESPLPVLAPFVEYSLGFPVGVPDWTLVSPDGTNVAVAASMPQRIGFGGRLTAFRDFTLTAGAELGLAQTVGLGVPATPPWTAFLAASFTVDPVARGETKLVETVRERRAEAAAAPPKTARVEGVVVDAATKKPVPGVIVAMVGAGLPPVATEPDTGRFLTHELPFGPVRLQASKDGYKEASRELLLEPGKSETVELSLEQAAKKARLLVAVTAGKKKIPATLQLHGAQEQQVPVPETAKDPVPVEVAAGHYQVNVTSPGHLAQARDVQISENAEMPLQFDLQPEPKKKLVIVEKNKIQILQQVHFATGKATILADSGPLLAQVVDAIVANDLKKLRIEGHTDNKGNKATNLKLSQDRATSVADWLAKAGIDRARLDTAGFGDTRPIAPNMTARGRELNRRVEFLIIER
ncbi:MAG TPA: OmpA family protein [Myxococcales bacterium]|nr:OmpA family protein [Myxococcales bacterium]